MNCKWFDRHWYSYLFDFSDNNYTLKEKLTVLVCRAKGHPNGPVYYNMHGDEPDMNCVDCGEEL